MNVQRLKYDAVLYPFKDGVIAIQTNYMWVEKLMREAEEKGVHAYYDRHGICCVCGWNRGTLVHDAMFQHEHYYIPLCKKCETFMWGTHGRRAYPRVLYNAVETNRRKF